MIDREARNRVCALIRSFLAREIDDDQLDEGLTDMFSSRDSVVAYVTSEVISLYEAFGDQLIVVNKPHWDYFQRLLLLLESDSTIEIDREWRCSITQPIAALTLFLSMGVMAQLGWSELLLLVTIPACLVCVVLDRLRRPPREVVPFEAFTAPFSSIRELELAHRAANFKKQRYPQELMKRQRRHTFMSGIYTSQIPLQWLIASPFILLRQSFPILIERGRVVPA